MAFFNKNAKATEAKPAEKQRVSPLANIEIKSGFGGGKALYENPGSYALEGIEYRETESGYAVFEFTVLHYEGESKIKEGDVVSFMQDLNPPNTVGGKKMAWERIVRPVLVMLGVDLKDEAQTQAAQAHEGFLDLDLELASGSQTVLGQPIKGLKCLCDVEEYIKKKGANAGQAGTKEVWYPWPEEQGAAA